jgi:hypothetical protein
LPNAAEAKIRQRFGQELVVSPVRAVHSVSWAQPNRRTYGAAFLPDARVGRAMDKAFAGQLQDGFTADNVRSAFGAGCSSWD